MYRMRRRPVQKGTRFLIIQHFLLFSQLQGPADDLFHSLSADACVNCEVVVLGMSPDPPCIVVIIIRTPAVHPARFLAGVLFGQIFCIHDPLYAVIFRRVEIDLQTVMPVPEKIVRASAEDDTVSLIGETADDFPFRFENGVPGSFLCIGVDVHLAYQVVEETVRHILFVLLYEFRSVSRGAEPCLPCGGNSADERFSGQHRHIGEDLRVYAESQDHTSDQQVNHRRKIALRIHKKEHDHGQVNEISEQDEIGDVPRSAFVIRLTPSELMKSPIRNTM